MPPKIFFVALGLLGLASLYAWIGRTPSITDTLSAPTAIPTAAVVAGLEQTAVQATPTAVPTKTPIPTVPEATPTPTPDRAADWVLRDVINLEGDIMVTVQGIVWKAPFSTILVRERERTLGVTVQHRTHL